MTDIEHNQSKFRVAALLDSFESFQLCGPISAAVIRLNDFAPPMEILKTNIDWSYITNGRPVVDCRVTIPKPAGMKKPALHLVK